MRGEWQVASARERTDGDVYVKLCTDNTSLVGRFDSSTVQGSPWTGNGAQMCTAIVATTNMYLLSHGCCRLQCAIGWGCYNLAVNQGGDLLSHAAAGFNTQSKVICAMSNIQTSAAGSSSKTRAVASDIPLLTSRMLVAVATAIN